MMSWVIFVSLSVQIEHGLCNQALVFLFLKSKLFVSFNFRAFRMASHFEEERFSLGEKSECMVTVTSLHGKTQGTCSSILR